MSTYAALSTSDKAIVQNTTQLLRSNSAAMARAFNTIAAIAGDTNAVGLVTSLGNGEVVPNESGLAGADDLTKEEIVALYTTIKTIRDIYDLAANRAAWSKAAGINATVGV